MEITLKNKCCLYVIISIRFFSITICNLLIDLLSYIHLCYLLPYVLVGQVARNIQGILLSNEHYHEDGVKLEK